MPQHQILLWATRRLGLASCLGCSFNVLTMLLECCINVIALLQHCSNSNMSSVNSTPTEYIWVQLRTTYSAACRRQPMPMVKCFSQTRQERAFIGCFLQTTEHLLWLHINVSIWNMMKHKLTLHPVYFVSIEACIMMVADIWPYLCLSLSINMFFRLGSVE